MSTTGSFATRQAALFGSVVATEADTDRTTHRIMDATLRASAPQAPAIASQAFLADPYLLELTTDQAIRRPLEREIRLATDSPRTRQTVHDHCTTPIANTAEYIGDEIYDATNQAAPLK